MMARKKQISFSERVKTFPQTLGKRDKALKLHLLGRWESVGRGGAAS